MCTTPAPPSTAFVAASIWSGTGEVNTSPGHAASSMPSPTKPPCSGSCPEPPPDTSATFPPRGPSARTTICASGSTRRMSPCAAARPASDSLTTRSGSLRNFLMDWVAVAMRILLLGGRDATRGAGVGGRDGGLDRRLDAPRRGERVIDDDGQPRADEPGQDVDGYELPPGRDAAADGRDELGAEGARRVQRGARDGSDDHDDRHDGAADDEAGEVPGRARIDDPDNREHEHERADALREDRRCPAGRVLVEGCLPHSEVDAGLGEQRPDAERTEDRADDLRGPVGRQLAPREALRGRQREGDGRVDVAARDLAEGVHERGDDEAERERDAEQVRACDGRLAVAGEHEGRHDRAGSNEHQQRGAQGLGERTLAEGVALHLFLLWKVWTDCDSTLPNAICNVLRELRLVKAGAWARAGAGRRARDPARRRPRAAASTSRATTSAASGRAS